MTTAAHAITETFDPALYLRTPRQDHDGNRSRRIAAPLPLERLPSMIRLPFALPIHSVPPGFMLTKSARHQ